MPTGPIVIKIGGTALEQHASAPRMWQALADLHQRRPRGQGVVLLHGGGKAVDAHLARLGFVTERREGIRITPPDQLDQITAVLAGLINKSLVGRLCAVGARAVGLCLGDGGAVQTVKTTRFSFDPGRVGEVVASRANDTLLHVLLRAGFLPVLSSIGIDAEGRFLNVNADDAAAGVAAVLGASSLVLMTDVPGLLDARQEVVPEANAAVVESMIAAGEITGGMIPKARAALDAAGALGAPVTILDGTHPDPIARWAAGETIGTRFSA